MKKKLSAILERLAWGGTVLILCGSLHLMTGCELLRKLGLEPSVTVSCDKDGCRVEGHVHPAPKETP